MNEPITAGTFAGMWRHVVEHSPDAPFLVFERPDEQVLQWTYGEFDVAVSRAARFMASHGVTPASAVHLALTNSPTFVAVWLAAVRLGAWIVPSDPMSATPELHGHISRTHPVIGFAAADRAATYRAALDDVSSAMPVVEIDEADGELAVFGRTPLGPWPATQSTRSGGGDVHVGHHRCSQGRRDHAGQLRLRRRHHGRRVRAGGGASPARRAADVPRQRAVLLVRVGDRGRRLGRA